ncbi:MAG TPA: S16 family serine protease, partial [Clostridia bacterium]|nr:S16 family serine protease [Clostridia bacterium]
VENVLTVLRKTMGVDTQDYDIHVNFPGGMPVDGPSAGVSIAVAVYSAITNAPVDNKVAMSGEISIRGKVKPVGGIVAKIRAAHYAGAEKVLVPYENYQELFSDIEGIEVVPVSTLNEVLENALLVLAEGEQQGVSESVQILSASNCFPG